MLKKILFLPFWTLLVLFNQGCTNRKLIEPFPLATESQLNLPSADSATGTTLTLVAIDSTVADTIQTPTFCKLADSLISKAEEQAVIQNYDSTHKLIVFALKKLDYNRDSLGSACENTGTILERIVTLYTQLMPQNYLDSLPDDVSTAVFNAQFSMYSDTLPLSVKESSIVISFNCDNGTPFNIPIVRNDRVQRALYNVAVKRKKGVTRVLGRASYYLPFMKNIFALKGMPTDLAYLPMLESGFNPKAYSYAHASGLWQFIPSTGRIYGLRINYWVDERRDPIKSTNAASEYLKKLYEDFSDWHLALAAYNCGERKISSKLKKDTTRTFWDMKLPKQTMNYVPLFIAYQMVSKNPQCFGFDSVETKEPFDLDTVKVSDCLDLTKIASNIGIKLSKLKAINPHLLHWCTPPDMTDITLYLPKGTKEKYKSYYNTLTDNDKVKWYRYKIKPGDNLLSIAAKFRISISAIKSINKMRGSRIVAGKHLFIPIPTNRTIPKSSNKTVRMSVKGSEKQMEEIYFKKKGIKPIKYRVKTGDTMYGIANLFGTTVADVRRWNNNLSPRRLKSGNVIKLYIKDTNRPMLKTIPEIPDTTNLKRYTYRVKSGDNIYNISKSVGVKLNDLISWNSKNSGNPIIHPGEKLRYYKSDNTVTTQKRTQTGTSAKYISYKIKKGDTFYSLANLFSVSVERLYEINNMKYGEVIHPNQIIKIPQEQQLSVSSGKPSFRSYTVKSGDTLWSIANRFNTTVKSILKKNNLSDASIIKPGMIIKIPSLEDS